MEGSPACAQRERERGVDDDRRRMNTTDAVGEPAREADIDLPPDLLRDDEIILLLLKPSPLFIVLFSLGAIAGIVGVTAALIVVSRFFMIPWAEVQIAAAGAGLLVLRLGWQMLDWYSRLYVLTDRRVIRRVGVLRTSTFESPLSNIQHTEVFARLRERVFGLGTLGFATSGTGRFEAFWVAVRQPDHVQRIVVEAIERYGRRR